MSRLDDPDAWREAFRRAWPELEVRLWPEVGKPEEVDFALAWKPEPGALQGFPNLKLIVNLGAGVDSITADETLPESVPIARLADEGQAQLMTGYALLAVLRHHREFLHFERAKREKRWDYREPIEHGLRKVGVMGLGYLGLKAATALADLGFDVAGWSRSRKDAPGISIYAGPDELPAFLGRSEILVNILPATAETRHILGRAALYQLPRGAKLVNIGRGATLDEEALIEALEEGQVSEATLDVFETEPLPPEHRFWDMEQVFITPHLASLAIPETAARQVVAECQRVLAGQPALYAVDRARGY